uniref:Tetratricopeptide repeat protein n=1 Tax=Craspedostauros australis TaxID=1486917 RepID=A0A7S0F4U4_9STRA
MPGNADYAEMLQSYQAALQEYNRVVKEGGDPVTTSVPQDPIYQGTLNENEYSYTAYNGPADDAYEADLHAAIGETYLQMGDIGLAVSQFHQSIDLYATIQDKDAATERALADVKMNLSIAYFHGRRFQDSERLHREGLELYRKLYGAGVNPYVQGIEDLAGMFGVDPWKESKGDDPAADDIKHRLIDIEKLTLGLQNATEGMGQQVEEEDANANTYNEL